MDFVRISCGLASLDEALGDVDAGEAAAIQTVNLHGNEISAMSHSAIARLRSLTRLDLSSNKIESMSGLEFLPGLTELNLSCNKIQEIRGLSNLHQLITLVLSFNRIATLNGMREMRGPDYKLALIDVKGNNISDFQQLEYLSDISSLKYLILQGDDKEPSNSNPICLKRNYHMRGKSILPNVIFDDSNASIESITRKYEDFLESRSSPPRQILQERPELSRNSIGNPSFKLSVNHKNEEMYIARIESMLEKLVREKPMNTMSAHQHTVNNENQRFNILENQISLLLDQISKKSKEDHIKKSRRAKIKNVEDVLSESTEYSSSEKENKRTFPKRRIKFVSKGINTDNISINHIQSDQSDIPHRSTEESTQKVLDALQREEQEFTDFKMRSAAQIKSLSDSLADSQKYSQSLQSKIDQLSSQLSHQEQELKNTILEKNKFVEIMQQSTQSYEKKMALESSVNSELKSELDALLKVKLENDNKILELEKTLLNFEDDKENIASRFIKEREHSKVRLAEYRREIDIYRTTIKQLQRENKSLHTSISEKEAFWQQQLHDIKTTHTNELTKAIMTSTTKIMEKHEREYLSSEKQLKSTRDAYIALENEFKAAVKLEQTKFLEIQSDCHNLQKEIESKNREIDEKNNTERELRSLIRELTLVVREQKAKIEELNSRNDATYSVFEEKIISLEDRLKYLDQIKLDWKTSRQELDISKKELEFSQKKMEELQIEIVDIKKKSALSIEQLQAELRDLQTKSFQDKEEITKLREMKESQDQTIRIKVKMLEDQNETIKTIKQNLDNKTREFSSSIQDYKLQCDLLQHDASKEKKIIRQLREEIASQEAVSENLQSAYDELKQERDHLQTEITEIMRKLRERNESIALIEQEVEKVKQTFLMKEQRLIQEKDSIIKSKEAALLEATSLCDSMSGRLRGLEQERTVLIEAAHSAKLELSRIDQIKADHDKEMKVVLNELDRQKAKFARLKDAISIEI